MKKYIAEFIGTFTLVLFGCGAAVIAGEFVGVLGIAFAFGFALIAMAYSIGNISGCHINPAVSLGMFLAKRMGFKDLTFYMIAQFLGAIAGAAVLLLILHGYLNGYNISLVGLGQNGFGADYGLGFSVVSAIVFELVATFLFVLVILESTKERAPKGFAGLIIGITLVVIHIVGIKITGTSVNPARSLAPAIFVGGVALQQLWLFIVMPLLAGAVAGLTSKVLD